MQAGGLAEGQAGGGALFDAHQTFGQRRDLLTHFAHADIDLLVRLDALALLFQALLDRRQLLGLLRCLSLLIALPAGQPDAQANARPAQTIPRPPGRSAPQMLSSSDHSS
ncbi:hypothetical protein [Pseudomonas nitroreducens]|uniref:hypothetical protein n=1 Tax=Pseudomonas nitroreducens TaxID=46680 RepID=UPI002D7E38CC|nr:hypothetical protein [Pseudomonas nitroreducens]